MAKSDAQLLAEQRLLGILLVHPSQFGVIQAEFRPEWFQDPHCRSIAKTIYETVVRGEQVSATRIAMKLRRAGQGDSAELIDKVADIVGSVITSEELESLAQYLHDRWQRRHVREQLEQAAREIAIAGEEMSTEEILERAQQALISAFVDRGKKEIQPWMDVLTALHAEWLEAQEGRAEVALPTGLLALTSALGGLRRKRMYLLAGRPSMGKSALAMNIVRYLAGQRGKRALVFTLEQSATEFAQRALSAQTRILADSWNRYPWQEEQRERLNAGLSRVMDWPIALVDIRKPTVDKIKMLARVEKANHPDLAAIVVDYLQEMKIPIGRGENLATAVGDVASELRALAGELDVALIVVSQLSRSVEVRDDKRPQMSDLRDSGRLEEVADTILFLYRPGYYHTLGSEELDNVSEVIIAKNRQGGGAGKATLAYFDRQYMSFSDIPDALKTDYLRAVNS